MTADPRAALAEQFAKSLWDWLDSDPLNRDAVIAEAAERGVLLVSKGFVESVYATSNDPHLVSEAAAILILAAIAAPAAGDEPDWGIHGDDRMVRRNR